MPRFHSHRLPLQLSFPYFLSFVSVALQTLVVVVVVVSVGHFLCLSSFGHSTVPYSATLLYRSLCATEPTCFIAKIGNTISFIITSISCFIKLLKSTNVTSNIEIVTSNTSIFVATKFRDSKIERYCLTTTISGIHPSPFPFCPSSFSHTSSAAACISCPACSISFAVSFLSPSSASARLPLDIRSSNPGVCAFNSSLISPLVCSFPPSLFKYKYPSLNSSVVIANNAFTICNCTTSDVDDPENALHTIPTILSVSFDTGVSQSFALSPILAKYSSAFSFSLPFPFPFSFSLSLRISLSFLAIRLNILNETNFSTISIIKTISSVYTFEGSPICSSPSSNVLASSIPIHSASPSR
ncbi:hypothetical protein AX774_g2325 [Zancudomyces culisetae]|uniref:Uncharacterized protein n=1 Tax=Zancudomyces culisetae TaxID=1213189 RepID=A0A1R1PT33_ZANCU|nr:hypothetical protein AX774_g2325 [Zancudomyces culisetae]|eukprot:OMH84155.1 hypothetical protein AX774_g2325 [Zancudomyces culisetae]